MTKFMLALFVLLALLDPGSAAEPDDISLARELVREAHGLCGAGCEMLTSFGAAQAKVGDLEASKRSFANAWAAAAKLEDGVERRIVLDAIAEAQAQAGQSKTAIENSLRLRSDHEQAMTLGTIAIVQAESAQANAALRTVDLMPQEVVWNRDLTLSLIAMTLSSGRDFAEALRVLDLIPSDVELAKKILAKNVPMHELSPQEQTVVKPVMMKSMGLIVVAQDQAEAGDLKAALQTVRSITPETRRECALWRVASVAADSGNLDVVQKAVDGIRNQSEEFKELTLVQFVVALAKQGRFERASDNVATIKNVTRRADAVAGIAAGYAAHGDAKATRSFFDTIISLTPSNDHAHNAAAKIIVRAYAEARHLEHAEAFVDNINDPEMLSEAFEAIAVANSRMKKTAETKRMFEKSRQAASDIVGSYEKCVRLRELATVQPEKGDRKGAFTSIKLAVEAAAKIEIGGGTDVVALTQTATSQFTVGDRKGAATTFELAKAAAARYPDEPYVASLLHDVASAQARVGQVKVAIASARAQESTFIRSWMLLGVANGILSECDVET